MDITTQVGKISSEYPSLIIIIAVAAFAIISLSFIVAWQNRRLNLMRKPKFGFLGKPLSLMATFGVAAFAVGVTFMINQNSTSIDTTQADREVTLTIEYQALTKTEYRLNAVPLINKVPWGETNENKFDIYWTITNTSSKNLMEYDLSQNNVGGIKVELQKGKNIIKATTFFQNKVAEKEVIINI